MIIETILATTNVDGSPQLSPMGPVFDEGTSHFELRPFAGSQSAENLKRLRSGVIHFVDDGLLFAQAVLHEWTEKPALRLADVAQAPMLRDHLRALEFQVTFIDDSATRLVLKCEVTREHLGRPPRGVCRGLHAVVEACILISRLDFLPRETIAAQWGPLQTLVQKAGNERDREAMRRLTERWESTEAEQTPSAAGQDQAD